MMRGYVLVGDFEGYVAVAIGLDDVVGYRVGELPGQPGRRSWGPTSLTERRFGPALRWAVRRSLEAKR